MINKLPHTQPTASNLLSDLQNKINEIFHIQSATSAPILISLGIFIFGLIFTELVKCIAAYNKRKTTRQIFLQGLALLSKGVERQGKAYFVLSEQIRFKGLKDKRNYTLGKVEIHQLRTLEQIGYESIFKAFFTGFENLSIGSNCLKMRVKAFNKIWEAIEIVRTWQEKLLNDGEVFMERLNSANSLREKAIEEYLNYVAPQLHSASRSGVNAHSILGKYFYGIDNILINWQHQADKGNPFVMHRSLVLPVRILDRKFSNQLDLVHTSSKHLMQASIGYQEMKKVISTYKQVYYEQSRMFLKLAKLINISKSMLS
jgi:hypothetical protein